MGSVSLICLVLSLILHWLIYREEIHGVIASVEKIVRESRFCMKPTLSDCLDGLRILEEMHQSELWGFLITNGKVFVDNLDLYITDVIKSLLLEAQRSGDLFALQQLLLDPT